MRIAAQSSENSGTASARLPSRKNEFHDLENRARHGRHTNTTSHDSDAFELSLNTRLFRIFHFPMWRRVVCLAHPGAVEKSNGWNLIRLTVSVLALLAISVTTAAGSREKETMTIIDFSQGDVIWPHINDGVMGGVSSGEMSVGDGYATFRGTVSFDNNGGFSSVRSPTVVHDLSMFEGLVLRVRGDGKRYGFRLKTDASFDGVSYQVQIEPLAGEWADISVPFADFIPVYRGRVVRGHPPLDPSRIATFGLIISQQEGPFRIDIESVRASPEVVDQGMTQ
jgi:hypothetical protein